MLTFEKMKREERNECAVLAARAFADYEYFSIYIEDERKRKRFLDALIKCEFSVNANLDTVKFFTVKEDGKILGVVQLCSPDFVKPADMKYLMNGWIGVLIKGGSKAVNAWNDMEKKASHPCHSLEGNTWYISLLTIDPEVEGRGIGTEFISRFIIPYVKKEGADALSLFTNSEINRRFYQKNGFREFDSQQFSYEGKSIGNWSYIMNF